jgi:hypothetical protein
MVMLGSPSSPSCTWTSWMQQVGRACHPVASCSATAAPRSADPVCKIRKRNFAMHSVEVVYSIHCSSSHTLQGCSRLSLSTSCTAIMLGLLASLTLLCVTVQARCSPWLAWSMRMCQVRLPHHVGESQSL